MVESTDDFTAAAAPWLLLLLLSARGWDVGKRGEGEIQSVEAILCCIKDAGDDNDDDDDAGREDGLLALSRADEGGIDSVEGMGDLAAAAGM